MPRTLHVHLLPSLTSPEELAGGVVVVIDVLRASTTIAAALAAGAEAVVPCLEVDEARRRAAELPATTVRLGGERGCVKIAGFDFGNSPTEYTPASIGGKTLVFTTTNGTKALLRCRQAAAVFVASFVNAAATLRAVDTLDLLAVHLLCAGTEGHVSREDVLFAGCFVERLRAVDADLNDSALLAAAAWRDCDRTNLASELRVSRGGRNLIRNGLAADIVRAADIDSLDLVARFEPAAGCIQRM